MKNQELSSPGTAFSYRFGSAEFHESRFELRVAGLLIETERRALEVLHYLLRHAGEVVTKEELPHFYVRASKLRLATTVFSISLRPIT